MTSLVIQTAFLGDVVLTTPLVEALARRHGPVDLVSTPAAASLVETHPAVRRVIRYDKRGTDRGVSGLLALGRRLREEHYESAYLPHRSLRSAALAIVAHIPRRVGFHDGWPRLYTEVRQRPAGGHEIDRLLALLEAPPGMPRPRLSATAHDDRVAVAVLADVGLPVVALAPGSIWGSKRWPYYKELAARLVERVGVVVVGGAEDAALGEEITAAAGRTGGRAVNACGRLTLRQAAALIARVRLLVTNDSAPLHLASAMGTPVVAIFGPTITEFGFGPIGAGDVALGVEGLPCRPCAHHGPRACPLGHHRCMRDLSVQHVLAAIEETGALHRRD